MASRTDSTVTDTPGDALPGSEQDQRIMEELRRVQLANEGMRLLLSSDVKKAEELFKSSRWVQSFSFLCGSKYIELTVVVVKAQVYRGVGVRL